MILLWLKVSVILVAAFEIVYHFSPKSGHRIPLWFKLAYTAFVAVLVPVYWVNWTPLNFLYFCDVALLVTLPALWLESSYLASMMAVAITLPQLLWQIDFIVYPLSGFRVHFPIDLAGYMFDPKQSLFTRCLSSFHFWLPIVLIWLVWRLGYDRRAIWGQVVLAIVVLWLSYLLTSYHPYDAEEPYGPAGNVNKVFGPVGDTEPPQTFMDPLLWLGVVMLVWTVGVYPITHLVLCWTMPRPQRDVGRIEVPSDAEGMFSSSASGETAPQEQIQGGDVGLLGADLEDGLAQPDVG
jgi:hypothetical protein